MSFSAQSSSFKSNLEAFWDDPFRPLQFASQSVLGALRNDEAAPNADLFRKLSATANESHRYYSSTAPLYSSTTTAGSSTGVGGIGNNANNQYTPGGRPAAGTPAGFTSPGMAATTMLSPGGHSSLITTNNSTTPGMPPSMRPATIPSEPPPTVTLKHVKSVPLPKVMADAAQSVREHSLMGLLPEAELAWMSIDSKLFVWPYTAASTPEGPFCCSFTIPSGQCVLSVGLVRPKKGVFRPWIKWCLVVTTPDEAILCALINAKDHTNSHEDWNDDNDNNAITGDGKLQLIPTIFSVATDFVRMLSVCGTKDGRIFLGGEDGCLYEMAYDGDAGGNGSSAYRPPLSLDEQLDQFYDEGKPTPAIIKDESRDNTMTGWVVRNGKRVLSSAIGMHSHQRPRKCRKMNHSSHASVLAKAIVPDFLIKAGSYLVGGGRATGGGKIVQIVADEERRCLYTLTSRGWICTYHLILPIAASPTTGGTTTNNQVRLAAVVDTAKTARLYLEAVSRGQVNSPSSYGSTTGNVTFAGGSASAKLGVGGMDGARSILKQAEFSMKSGVAGRNSNSPAEESSLTPVSLHVVPRKESSCVTVVAITKSGLRYYLSSLPKNAFTLLGGKNVFFAPDKKITLFHVRAPPPIASNGKLQDMSAMDSDVLVGGIPPRVAGSSGKVPQVDAGYYEQGTMVLALEHQENSASSSTNQSLGDLVVAVAPDAVARAERKATTGTAIPVSCGGQPDKKAPGGVSETISIPMLTAQGFYGVADSGMIPVLPGGKVWGIGSSSPVASPVLNLALNSQTPTDNELSVGLVPEFVPSSRIDSRGGGAFGRSRISDYRSSGNSIVSSEARRTNLTGTALTVVWNLMISRPMHHGIKMQEESYIEGDTRGRRVTSNYRISVRPGTKGFSMTAAEQSSTSKREGTVTRRSARLNQWLLRPSTVPLNPFTVQHLLPPRQIVMLNADGLQYFELPTLLTKLEEALMRAGVNVREDETVSSFFSSYGHPEGCAMCILIAIAYGSSNMPEELKDRAKRAAMARAYVPKLTRVPHDSQNGGIVQNVSSDGDVLIPAGYNFCSSAIFSGVMSVTSRLLRPIWFKPAVVVTEGRMVQLSWSSNKRSTPAKVELLLDEKTLDEVVRPLQNLADVMKDLFAVAVRTVPGANRKPSDAMDIDGDSGQGHYFTNSMRHQMQLRDGAVAATGELSSEEQENIARLTEERKIHCLYRLLSRCVQLLRLLSLLDRAHFTPGLPEVDWGTLHGLTIAQLVQSRETQVRLEKLLNRLVTSAADIESSIATNEADNLARQLADNCYLFFSPGSHFAYLGFRLASQAKACQYQSAQQHNLTSRAADNFRKASEHWNSASLITGRSLQTKSQEGYGKIATTAYSCGSLLAMAVSDLVVLEDVDGAVEICLTAASNFRRQSLHNSGMVSRRHLSDAEYTFPWEHGLYHKRQVSVGDEQVNSNMGTNGTSMSASPSNAMSLGTAVTSRDAVDTCYALIFHSISQLLTSHADALALRMVARCAGETNNEDFLHKFFAHMDKSGHRNILLRIESSTQLEKWLESHDDPSLLYGYYTQQGEHAKAGTISMERALRNTVDMHLDERIECLSRAAASFSTALQGSGGNMPAELGGAREHERSVRDLIDNAKHQRNVLHAAQSFPEKCKLSEEAYQRLEKGPLFRDVNSLYNDYAAAMDLYDVMLRILQSCESTTNHDEISRLWKLVVCEELAPCATRNENAYRFLQGFLSDYATDEVVALLSRDSPVDDQRQLFENDQTLRGLGKKVIGLGRELYDGGKDFIFPIDSIIDLLESLRRTHVESGGSMTSPLWTLNILVEVGVPYIAVLEAYDRSARRAEQSGFAGHAQEQLRERLKSSLSLVLTWVSAPRKKEHTDELTRVVSSQNIRQKMLQWRLDIEKSQQRSDLRQDLKAIDEKLCAKFPREHVSIGEL